MRWNLGRSKRTAREIEEIYILAMLNADEQMPSDYAQGVLDALEWVTAFTEREPFETRASVES